MKSYESHQFDDDLIESLDYDLDPFETHENLQSHLNTPSPTESIIAPTIFDSAPIQFSTYSDEFDYFMPREFSTIQSSTSTVSSTVPPTTTSTTTESTTIKTSTTLRTTEEPTTTTIRSTYQIFTQETALPTLPPTPSTSSSILPTTSSTTEATTEKILHHAHHHRKAHKPRKQKHKHRQYLPPPSDFDDFDPNLEIKNDKELDFETVDKEIHMVDGTLKRKKTKNVSSEKVQISSMEQLKSTQKTSEIITINPPLTTVVNSKIFEIKAKSNVKKRSVTEEENFAQGFNDTEQSEPLLANDMMSINEDAFIIKEEKAEGNIFPAALIGAVPNFTQSTELQGIGGFLQSFLGTQDKFDPKVWFQRSPNLEFLNLALALLVWSVRYPSVFWDSSKAFALIFSLQMIINSIDVLLLYVGTSILFKLEIVGQFMTIHNQPSPLLLNGIVTLALTLLAYVLIIASSMILYLYGHSRLSAKIRDCQMITLKDGDLWSYFSHCASLCFILGISVVKAPIIHDLSIVYRISLDKTVFVASEYLSSFQKCVFCSTFNLNKYFFSKQWHR